MKKKKLSEIFSYIGVFLSISGFLLCTPFMLSDIFTTFEPKTVSTLFLTGTVTMSGVAPILILVATIFYIKGR